MKRAIVVSIRQSKDSKSGENNAWLTMAIMPSKSQNGNIFYPTSKNIAVTTCAGELRAPDNYKAYNSLKIGDIVDITYGFNEISQKPFVSGVALVSSTPYKMQDLIV